MKKIKKGMTLLEVVIAMCIFSIVMVGISSVVTFSFAAQLRSRSQFDVNVIANSIIDYAKVNKDLGNNTYKMYFNTGDELKADLNALKSRPTESNTGCRFYATMEIASYTGSGNLDNLCSITVTAQELKDNGKTCRKVFYVDR